MKFTVDIAELNIGQIEVNAKSLREAEDIAVTLYHKDIQNVDWYKSETTFNGVSEDVIVGMELRGFARGECTCDCDGHCENCSSDNRCIVCGDIIPEGRMVCPSCEVEQGGERNGRQTHCVEQRKSELGGLAGRFRSGISRLFRR